MSKKHFQNNRRQQEVVEMTKNIMNHPEFWRNVLKPKPKYIPLWVWKKLLGLVIR